ncbi:phosphoribosylformylglycinamidine synthase subunit PurS [Bacteroidota bacterium]|nr:phosphoribosylformylglycinamidine synthase subunit PurS [Bacteroidota bacterium]MEC8537204.1 phosphoribosylformylglycinamidine synthase subunit PurS [Bacteroidota bacterium]
MNFIAKINIMPKEALLDPQGNAVKKAMNNLKLSSQKVRIGKHIIIELSCETEKEASNIIEESCKKLLANQITEEYSYTIEEITS